MTGIEPAVLAGCPETYRTIIETSSGIFEIEAHRGWSLHGADRFFQLVEQRYYDDSRFYRVVAGKWVQFGIAGAPSVALAWRGRTIPDDRRVQSNTRGFVAFANTGPDTRATQVFINLSDNAAQNDLEAGFAPFGQTFSGFGGLSAVDWPQWAGANPVGQLADVETPCEIFADIMPDDGQIWPASV